MKVLRIYLKGWTASFRYPGFMTAVQPTLPVPPISTIYGILSAAKGELVTPKDVEIGFVFRSFSKTFDLEAIYEMEVATKPRGKANICQREIMMNPELFIYIKDLGYKKYFQNPEFPLLIGRSSDLAMVKNIEVIDLIEKNNPMFEGTLIPYGLTDIATPMVALPTHFSNDLPRKSCGVKPFFVIDKPLQIELKSFIDPEHLWGVYFYRESIN